MILGGDIGGTKCNLALLEQEKSGLRILFQHRLATRNYAGFDSLIEDFLQQAVSADVRFHRKEIAAAGFGVAGVVTGGKHYSENLPWALDVAALGQNLELKNICLLNDLAATALSLEGLSASDMITLNAGTSVTGATRGVIAAGTGLGEALLFWDGAKYRVAAAEGGQADFAPRTEREIQLLIHLKRQLDHVSSEEIASGRGFRRIHEMLNPSVRHESFDPPGANAAGEITQLAFAKSCPVCMETLDFWVEMFAGVTGNFALQTMALGGVFIAGGIAAKILPKLREDNFFRSFCGAGKLAAVMAQVPIAVLTNEDAPMLGAAYEALHSLRT